MKKNYNEGTLFAIPLSTGGFGVGLIARSDNKGVIVAYLFGKKFFQLPLLDECLFNIAHAISIPRIGDREIVRGIWPIIGEYPNWNRSDWPLPAFGRVDALMDDVGWRTEYPEIDLVTPKSEIRITSEEAIRLPKNGLLNGGAAVKLSTYLLDNGLSELK